MDDYEIMECIDEGLNLFGPNIKYTVYWRMTILNNLPREGILVNPEAFVKGLQSIFGPGAALIETEIVRRMREKFDMEDLKSENLPEAIRHVRKQIAKLIDVDLTAIEPPMQASFKKLILTSN